MSHLLCYLLHLGLCCYRTTSQCLLLRTSIKGAESKAANLSIIKVIRYTWVCRKNPIFFTTCYLNSSLTCSRLDLGLSVWRSHACSPSDCCGFHSGAPSSSHSPKTCKICLSPSCDEPATCLASQWMDVWMWTVAPTHT